MATFASATSLLCYYKNGITGNQGYAVENSSANQQLVYPSAPKFADFDGAELGLAKIRNICKIS